MNSQQNQLNKRPSGRKMTGIILLVGPTVLILLSILLYAVTNFMFMSTETPDGLFDQQSPLQMAMNIGLYLMGVVSVITWLPGLIIGIVLLTTQKK